MCANGYGGRYPTLPRIFVLHRSRELSGPQLQRQLYRVRLDAWRVVYAVSEADRIVDVLAVRKRPPYDYGDLEDLLAGLQ